MAHLCPSNLYGIPPQHECSFIRGYLNLYSNQLVYFFGPTIANKINMARSMDATSGGTTDFRTVLMYCVGLLPYEKILEQVNRAIVRAHQYNAQSVDSIQTNFAALTTKDNSPIYGEEDAIKILATMKIKSK